VNSGDLVKDLSLWRSLQAEREVRLKAACCARAHFEKRKKKVLWPKR